MQMATLDPEALDSLGQTFRALISGYLLQTRYLCDESVLFFFLFSHPSSGRVSHASSAALFCPCRALVEYQKLPLVWKESLWLQKQQARCLYELTEYSRAEKIYQRCRRLQPHCTEGLEFHSTCLWHLQETVKLSNLAQECHAFDRMAPETW